MHVQAESHIISDKLRLASNRLRLNLIYLMNAFSSIHGTITKVGQIIFFISVQICFYMKPNLK